MDYDDGFILQKTVDWSLLNDGMTIPVSVCSLFRAWDESILTHGQQGTIGYDPPSWFFYISAHTFIRKAPSSQ